MAQFPPYTTSGVADANGNLTLTFRGRSNDILRVTQATAEMPGAGSATCSIRYNGFLISPMVPTGDAAAGDPPIWIQPGDELTAVWAAAPVGAIGQYLVIFDLGA